MSRRKLVLNLPLCLALIFAGSFALTVIMFKLQATEAEKIEQCMRESGYAIFALNFLPIFITMTFLFFLCGNLVIAGGTTSFLVILFSVTNRLKTLYRFDPFVPWDIALGAEVLSISKSFSPKLLTFIIAGFLSIIAVTAAGFAFIKNTKIGVPLRAACAACAFAAAAACNGTIMSDMELNAELPLIGNEYNRVDQFNSKGFIYEFIYVFNSGKIIKPKDYDAKAVEREMRAWEAAGDADAGEKRPHLFLILAEGFSEIPMNPVFSFPSDNPMENYKKLKSEGASGFIVTPSIGGGTADTEFDALTGVSSRNFRGSAYSYSLIVKKMNALPRIMAKAGYFTEAIHPGYPWFYNRSNVLPLLGFENFISSDDFPNAPTKGMYITEEASYERLVEEFENHLASGDDRPYFGFLITIQNHGPYFGKYRDGLTFGFDYDAPFSAKSLNELANYFYGVNDMDDELGKFAEYLQGMSEPAVFAYFGDHLPALGDEIYDIALEGDELTRLYETPYLVWANDSARPIALDGFADKMSSFFFGASIAESLGVSQKDPFFSFINDLKRSVPIILEDNYFAGDGVSRKNGGGAYDEKVSIYDNWAYYRVFESVD